MSFFIPFLPCLAQTQTTSHVTLSVPGIGKKIVGTLPVISRYERSASYVLLENGKVLYFGVGKSRPFTDEQAKILILAKESPNSAYIKHKGKKHKVINTLMTQCSDNVSNIVPMAYVLLDDGSVLVFTTVEEQRGGLFPQYCPWPYSREEAKILMLAEKQETYITEETY